jgi:hypothetical protein
MNGVANSLAVVVALASGCGSTPAPKPLPAELEITGPESLAGRWVAGDDMDFYYQLTITADGTYSLVVDRGKLSRCEQSGLLVRGEDARHYSILQPRVTCDPVSALSITIKSFTGMNLVVQTSIDGTTQTRTYMRGPE